MNFQLLLVAVAIVTIDCYDPNFYELGIGKQQEDFDFPARLPYVKFKTFCEEAPVREVIIQGRFKDQKRINEDFYFSLRLEQNEKTAKRIEWNMMSYASFIHINRKGDVKKSTGYLYSLATGDVKHYAPFTKMSGIISTDIKAEYEVGRDFVMRILVQPSHYLIILEYDGVGDASNTIQQYYGYFYDSKNGDSHWNEYTDSIFDTVHIEGDAEIVSYKVKSGGPFTPISDIPNYIKTKPYLKRSFLHIQPVSEDGATRYKLHKGSTETRFIQALMEWEINLRGKTGREQFHIIFEDIYAGYDMVKIISTFGSEPSIKIESQNTRAGHYSPTDEYLKVYKSTYDQHYSKYTANPFKADTDFELSIRRLSATDKNSGCYSCQSYDDYNGYPRTTLQITIRVQCRIYTWYVHFFKWRTLDNVKLYGDVQMHEVVLLY